MRLTYILKWIGTPLEESTSTWKTDHNTLKVDPEKGVLKVQNYGIALDVGKVFNHKGG